MSGAAGAHAVWIEARRIVSESKASPRAWVIAPWVLDRMRQHARLKTGDDAFKG